MLQWLTIFELIQYNQGNHKNFDQSLKVALTDFFGDDTHKKKLKKKKIQNGWHKETEFFKIANSQFFFLRNFNGLVLGLVELIDSKGIDVAPI